MVTFLTTILSNKINITFDYTDLNPQYIVLRIFYYDFYPFLFTRALNIWVVVIHNNLLRLFLFFNLLRVCFVIVGICFPIDAQSICSACIKKCSLCKMIVPKCFQNILLSFYMFQDSTRKYTPKNTQLFLYYNF